MSGIGDRVTKAVPVPSGEILFVLKEGADLTRLVPVFFDSRREVYVDKNGDIVDLEKDNVVDSGSCKKDFQLTPEGIEKMKQAYPADI